jgi:hypothetical protein
MGRRLPALWGATVWPYLATFGTYAIVGTIYGHTHQVGTANDPITLWHAMSFPAKLSILVGFVALASVSYGLAFAGISLLVYGDLRGERVLLASTVGRVVRSFLPLIVLSFLIGCGVFFGSLLLYLPGLIVQMLTAFAIPVMLLEEAGIKTSLRRSKRLASDRIGILLGLALTMFVVIRLFRIICIGLIGLLDTWALFTLIGVGVLMLMCVYLFVFRTSDTGLAQGPSYTFDLSSPFQFQVRTAQIVAQPSLDRALFLFCSPA